MGARKTWKKRGPKGSGRRRQTLTAVGSNALVLSTFLLNGAFAAETAAEAAPAEGPPVESAPGETAQPAQGPALSEGVLTGTHIVCHRYSAPAPLTVVREEAIKSPGHNNIAALQNTP